MQQVEKVALWPKRLTQEEIDEIIRQEEAERRAQEEAEALAAE